MWVSCVNETLLQEKTAQSMCPGDHGSETFYIGRKHLCTANAIYFELSYSKGGFPPSFNFPCDQASGPQLPRAMTTKPVFNRSIIIC